MTYDVAIVGGGPGGLAAALTLGRARKRVLLFDAGERRNAKAERIQNFVTRDGTPPDEFRRIAREQLATYPNVGTRALRVESITGARGAFRVAVGSDAVAARRILLATGMVDELPATPGFRELWGHAIFQCPYCHGWEVQDRRWGYWPRAEPAEKWMGFALKARGWTRDLVVFTAGEIELGGDERRKLEQAGIALESRPVARLIASGERLEAVELEGGGRVACEVLFAHPPQRQVELVQALGLALDDDGCVRIDPATRETSVPGLYAAGDLTTRKQGAINAAAAGAQAAVAINAELGAELALSGAI
jgi:thioredoxin reductase